MAESSHTDTIAAPAPGCLSEDEIVDYCNDEADESARRRVEVHIDRCGECRALIAEFVPGWQGRATALQDALDHTDSQSVAPEPVAPGQVGRYVLLERKGAGGMGVVYMATIRSWAGAWRSSCWRRSWPRIRWRRRECCARRRRWRCWPE